MCVGRTERAFTFRAIELLLEISPAFRMESMASAVGCSPRGLRFRTDSFGYFLSRKESNTNDAHRVWIGLIYVLRECDCVRDDLNF